MRIGVSKALSGAVICKSTADQRVLDPEIPLALHRTKLRCPMSVNYG